MFCRKNTYFLLIYFHDHVVREYHYVHITVPMYDYWIKLFFKVPISPKRFNCYAYLQISNVFLTETTNNSSKKRLNDLDIENNIIYCPASDLCKGKYKYELARNQKSRNICRGGLRQPTFFGRPLGLSKEVKHLGSGGDYGRKSKLVREFRSLRQQGHKNILASGQPLVPLS